MFVLKYIFLLDFNLKAAGRHWLGFLSFVFLIVFSTDCGLLYIQTLEGPKSSCWAPPNVLFCIFSRLPASHSFPGVSLAAQSNTGCPPCSIQPSVCVTNRPKHISLMLVVAADCEPGINYILLFVSSWTL